MLVDRQVASCSKSVVVRIELHYARIGIQLPYIVAAERMTVVLFMVRQVGEGFVDCIVGVFWEVWPHAMSVMVVVRVTAAKISPSRYMNPHLYRYLFVLHSYIQPLA